MKRHKALRITMFAALAIIACAIFGLVVMGLWNWLMPAVFGLRVITYWQALALLVLSRILFGGFRGRGGYGGHWRRRMRERWEQMTPEEREKFRQGMHGGCGSFAPPATEPKG